ncbi:uncharacterized protein LOC121402853 [Xenopus laevis]|uniref:Uncharacterized protein LOC121402853 n=2 Tax=Xenopus laevis TaxID=8355 RepID=A0A1L8GMY9_XENLA|nr:uncharacterized protein LOC121402853 [Xenopus laevis]OCT85218.1 hypothetical protein XELAEV_18023382mg [Xenopus laevis]
MEQTVCLPTPQRAQVASFKSKWSILHICAIGTLVLSMALLTFCLVFHKANHLTVCGSKAKYETETVTWTWESKMCSQDWIQANNSTVEINRTGFYMIHIQVSYPGDSRDRQGKRSQIELQVLCDGEKKNIKKREIYFSNDISPGEKKSVTLDVSALLMKGNKIHLNIHENTNIILQDESLTFWEINAIVGLGIWPSGHCTTEK